MKKYTMRDTRKTAKCLNLPFCNIDINAAMRYFFYFLLYSVFGWLYEVFLEVVIYQWGYSDRGVLFGPWCPVYGVGAMAFLLFLRPLLRLPWSGVKRFLRPILIFLACMALATAIELAASYLLEAIIGTWPWQTYVGYAINFQGRIALSPSLRFGLGGVLFLYLFQPAFEWVTDHISLKIQQILFRLLLAIFLLDCAATVVTIVT